MNKAGIMPAKKSSKPADRGKAVPISLRPLSTEAAIAALLQTPVEKVPEPVKKTPKRRAR